MSEEKLKVQPRQEFGTRNTRRLRKAGSIPVVLYGHGEETVSLACAADDLAAVMRHGSRVVELTGAVQQTALMSDVQWDTYGQDVLHVDFTRVSASELVTTAVAVETRGMAPGLKEGGIVEQPVHEVEIELPASQVTDKLELNINQLHLGDSLTAAELELPEGATLLTPVDTVLVQCVEPQVEEEDEGEEGVETSLEPEVIGEQEDEESEES